MVKPKRRVRPYAPGVVVDDEPPVPEMAGWGDTICEPTGKHRYSSRRLARLRAIDIARINGQRKMLTYQCDKCHGWHLSSIKKG